MAAKSIQFGFHDEDIDLMVWNAGKILALGDLLPLFHGVAQRTLSALVRGGDVRDERARAHAELPGHGERVWSKRTLGRLRPPLITWEAVLSETLSLLRADPAAPQASRR